MGCAGTIPSGTSTLTEEEQLQADNDIMDEIFDGPPRVEIIPLAEVEEVAPVAPLPQRSLENDTIVTTIVAGVVLFLAGVATIIAAH